MTKGINQDYYSVEGVDYTTPLDKAIENEEGKETPNAFRENALAYLRIMSLAMSFIIDSDDQLAAAYGVCFAMGLTSVLDNQTMADVARQIGCTRATISNYSKQFQRQAGLPESPLQKTETATKNSRDARNRVCENLDK